MNHGFTKTNETMVLLSPIESQSYWTRQNHGFTDPDRIMVLCRWNKIMVLLSPIKSRFYWTRQSHAFVVGAYLLWSRRRACPCWRIRGCPLAAGCWVGFVRVSPEPVGAFAASDSRSRPLQAPTRSIADRGSQGRRYQPGRRPSAWTVWPASSRWPGRWWPSERPRSGSLSPTGRSVPVMRVPGINKQIP